ncbi:MAG: S41 family peptidase, partial [Terriglobales bacterium]
MRYPDISKDKVAFVYAGRLWITARTGGPAQRVTTRDGAESFPKFSPDGKWIAFTGNYDGNGSVYLVSTEGGAPRRLTFAPTNDGDEVLGWTRDGSRILFASNKSGEPPESAQLYLVTPRGEMAERLPVPRATLASFSPDGLRVAFLQTSLENQNWRHYRGGWSPPIGLFDLATKSYEELPRSGAWDLFPMWYGNTICFASDRDGTMNLWRFDLATKQTHRLTDFRDFDVKYPSLGSDAIVFENSGWLYKLDLTTDKTSRIAITLPADAAAPKSLSKDVSGDIGSIAIAPDGSSAVVDAHGDIFTLDAKAARDITETSDVHELGPAISPDGKWIAYLSDRSGEYEIWMRPRNGGTETRVTFDGHAYRYDLVWSPNSSKVMFRDNIYRLCYADLATKETVDIDRGEYSAIKSGSWSPDNRWIAYSKSGTNGAGTIWLYSLASRKSVAVTNDFYDNTEPVFDPDGNFLFFLSQRFFYPSHDRFENRFNYYDTTGLFALALRADERSPFVKSSPSKAQFRVDLNGIALRIAAAPV